MRGHRKFKKLQIIWYHWQEVNLGEPAEMMLRTQGGDRILFILLMYLNSRPQGAMQIILISYLCVRSVSEQCAE